ncbi:DNA topoisomerase III [Clostridium sp. AM29-11AC]|uniref:DNA topoisomerase III n=1 Tax=Clostridium sp. AM29-11AC TaxID=2293028 RepID=UPI000E5519AB|nr:DNA topoisomerase III [Clostridium sp. AM29-11AC]RHT58283.1 DNA topoisomerase III [Clostridium sp. AM29-11AC]
MKSLVIAEKPSVGKDIARVLGCRKSADGCLEGDKYIVTWAFGHLVELAAPEEYDKKYKDWNMADLPMMPEPFKLEVIGKTAKQFGVVKHQLFRNDVKDIVIATDAGREGELVARFILMKAGCRKPLKRLWISSVTDRAIKEGFSRLRDGREYNHLRDAAMCRAEADWLVGLNATRALTCKYNAQLSCGRVQTPTLAIIAKREEEIRNFRPKAYWGLTARTSKPALTLTWQDKKSGGMRSFDRDRMEGLQKSLRDQQVRITKVKKTPKKTMAPLLYDLTELQRDANKRFGYSAKETLNIMQRLYENHKVLTYPRTDSRYLSSDVADTIHDRLAACGTGPYRKLAGKLSKNVWTKKASFINDGKVTDHHAIIPTEQFVQLQNMTSEERKIYDLVVRRFLAVLYPAAEYDETVITAEIGGEIFTARGKVMRTPGWREVYESADESGLSGTGGYLDEEDGDEDGEGPQNEERVKAQTLPDLREGDVTGPAGISLTEGKTKPPAPFNEATLLSAMENPVRYMESGDRAMAKTLGETGGLGTVATRADIIEKLFSGFMLEKKGKDICLTSKAKQLLRLVPEDLRKPELTAQWEMRLSKIAEGEMKRDAFMEDIRTYTKDIVEEIKGGEGTFRHDNLTNTKCPRCGKRMLSVKGKNSQMLVCQDRECGYRETISRTSNARCPKCHKKMELRGKGENQMFSCVCGYKEKLSNFKERRQREGAGVTKRDVARYLNQQKKEEKMVNNPFADALKKMQEQDV